MLLHMIRSSIIDAKIWIRGAELIMTNHLDYFMRENEAYDLQDTYQYFSTGYFKRSDTQKIENMYSSVFLERLWVMAGVQDSPAVEERAH